MKTRLVKLGEGEWQLIREYEVNGRRHIRVANFDGSQDDLVRAANKTREQALQDKGILPAAR